MYIWISCSICFGQTAHVFGCFSVCVQMQQHLLPFPWPIRCTCTRFIETLAEVSSRTGSEEQGQMYIYIYMDILFDLLQT